jgi:hypothetical protein
MLGLAAISEVAICELRRTISPTPPSVTSSPFYRPYSTESADVLPFATESRDVLPFSTETVDVIPGGIDERV